MAWLRIDDGFASHPKLAKLNDRQFRVWMRLLCYCAKHRDPSVDDVARREVPGLDFRTISRFSSLGLLDPQGEEWEVHDWLVYLPKDATNAARQARWRSRVTALRNAERNDEVTEADRYGNGPSPAGTRGKAPSRTRPNDPEGSNRSSPKTVPAVPALNPRPQPLEDHSRNGSHAAEHTDPSWVDQALEIARDRQREQARLEAASDPQPLAPAIPDGRTEDK